MEWACTNCGRTYHDPPEGVCQVCSAGTVVPADDVGEDRTDAALDRARRVLVDPGSLDSGLAEPNRRVSILFALILAFSALLVVAVAVGTLL